MQPVNILTIISDLEPAGPERRLLVLGKRMKPRVMQHVWVTSNDLFLLAEFDNARIPVKATPVLRGYCALPTVVRMLRYVRRHAISLVNVFDLKGLFLALQLRFFSNGRVRIIYNHVTAQKDFSSRQLYFFRRFVGLADHVVCNSHFSKTDLSGTIGPDKVTVIENGVDTAMFDIDPETRRRARKEFGFQDDMIIIGMVAGFRPVKNYSLLLRAFVQLASERQDMRLLCVGDGAELESMQSLAAYHGEGKKVVFAGRRTDVAYCLQSMDILCLTSLWEGMPNALLEGMACGLPVVASNVGGCGEVVLHGTTGLLFPANDKQSLVSALQRLADDPDQRLSMGRNGRQRVMAKYTLEGMVQTYISFFQKVAG